MTLLHIDILLIVHVKMLKTTHNNNDIIYNNNIVLLYIMK